MQWFNCFDGLIGSKVHFFQIVKEFISFNWFNQLNKLKVSIG